jgi:hypothetical protein
MAHSPSSRLVRAAAAERMGLLRERERLSARRDGVARQLAALEQRLADAEERLDLIDRLAPEAANVHPLPARAAREGLTGAAIRRAAIEVLAAREQGPGAIHYKDWFALLEQAGHQVAGKDPLAVFLTQLARSPLVRRSTQAGVYELDLGAPVRLRRRLDQLHAQLAERSRTTPGSPERAERDRLLAEIATAERALDEAERTLPEGAATGARAAG